MLQDLESRYTVKKVGYFPVPTPPPPSRDVTNQTLLARESLVSDIPAGDGKIDNIFLQCRSLWIVSQRKQSGDLPMATGEGVGALQRGG